MLLLKYCTVIKWIWGIYRLILTRGFAEGNINIYPESPFNNYIINEIGSIIAPKKIYDPKNVCRWSKNRCSDIVFDVWWYSRISIAKNTDSPTDAYKWVESKTTLFWLLWCYFYDQLISLIKPFQNICPIVMYLIW